MNVATRSKQLREIYSDKQRCAACGGKCCRIYRPIALGGSFPAGDIGIEAWNRDFHPDRSGYGVRPLFDPVEVHCGNSPDLHEALTQRGINPEWCEYIGESGCRLPAEKRPEQCLSFRCDAWLAEE